MLLFMHKQTEHSYLLKKKTVSTRLHDGPVFLTLKPNNEKSKLSVLYRDATNSNAMKANVRNMPFKDFKLYQKKHLNTYFKLN